MQNIILGILTGSILAIATVGFSMIRQSEGIINIAHGQFLTLGAFLGYFFVADVGLNIFLAGFLSAVCVGGLGVVVNHIAFRPLFGRGVLATLFTAIGLAYLMYGAILAIFGSQVRFFPVGFGKPLSLGPFDYTMGEVLLVVVAVVCITALGLFLAKTRLGTWIRASASNPELARLRGVPVVVVSDTVWFIGCALAGLAGVMIGFVGNVNAELGWQWILLILSAAVLGGLGSIYGVIAAAMIVGMAMDLSALVIPGSYRMIVAFVILMLVLLLRPQGIFSIAGRKEAV